MKVLDPYDGAITVFVQIHLLFIIRGVTSSLEDFNANIIKVTSNISLLYENKLDGWKCLKEKKKVSHSGH